VSALPNHEYAAANVGAEVTGRGRWGDVVPTSSVDHDFGLAPPQLVEVMCECGGSNCTGEIVMSLEEYEAVRLHPSRFLIKEGHEVADVVRVVGYGTGSVVVAKFERDLSRSGGFDE
jgi:AraC-like DNA-binding protein